MGARLLIVEDHDLLAQSLEIALRADGFTVDRLRDPGSVDIVAAVDERRPDVVLLDLDIGGALGSTLPLIPALRQSGARIVMLTGITDRIRLAECIEMGAIGIVGKHEPFERLLDGVREAVELGTMLTTSQRDELLAELRRQRASDQQRLAAFERLTRREQEVLAGLMEGDSAEVLARHFVVSLATVRSQIRAVLTKLGVNSQLAAVALARRAGWKPPQQS